MFSRRFSPLHVPLLLALTACSGKDITGPAVASITVTLARTSMLPGETTVATASLEDAGGLPIVGRPVTWSSSAATVATISASGGVTAVAPGTTVIRAASEGRTGEATLTVLAPVATITVTLAANSINVGATTQATAVLRDASGGTLTGRTVSWSSSATGVATVSSSGVVTGVSQGTSSITASAEGMTGSAPVTVVVPPPGSFSLSSPVNRASNLSTTPDFSWSAASGATTYTLEVATTSDFGTSTIYSRTGITTTSHTVATALTPLTPYFWRVTAVNAGGSTPASNGPRDFSTFLAMANPNGVAVSPDGARIYVVNGSTTQTVSVIDAATKQVVATIPTSRAGGAIAMRPSGGELAVSVGNAVDIVNTATNTLAKTFPSACVGISLYDIAYTPDGSKVALVDAEGGASGCATYGLRLITVASGASQLIPGSFGGWQGIAIMPNGHSALITPGVNSGSITRINLSTQTVTAIPGTGTTFGIAVTPDNTTAIAAGGGNGIVKRIALATNGVSDGANVTSSQGWHNVAITPDGAKAVVLGGGSTSSIIQLSDNSVVATIPTGGNYVTITPDGKYTLFTVGTGSSGTLRIVRIP